MGRAGRKSLGYKENKNSTITEEAEMGNGDVRKRGTVATVESDFLLCTLLLLNLPKYLTNKIWLRFRNSINLN